MAIPMSQYKAVRRFTNKFPSDLLDAILSSSVKSINYALLFFGCILFHILGTWILPLLHRFEPRFLEASPEMTGRKNYIVPSSKNQRGLYKPPFPSWPKAQTYLILAQLARP